MMVDLYWKLVEINTYCKNDLVKCWNGFAPPNVGDFIHTHKAEYKVIEVHWVQDNREGLNCIPINLNLEFVSAKSVDEKEPKP